MRIMSFVVLLIHDSSMTFMFIHVISARLSVKRLLALTLLGAVPVLAAPSSSSQQDVSAIIAAARQALGGEAALAAVQTLTIQGSLSRKVGPVSTSESLESTVILPDRFLRVSRRLVNSPIASYDITHYDGFDGDAIISDIVAPNAPRPVVIPGLPPATPEEADARRTRLLDRKRQMFLTSMIPLFVSLPAPHRLEMTAAGKAPTKEGQADVIDMKRPDGTVWRLLIDDKTHLPFQVMWKAKPIVTMTMTSTTVQGVLVGPTGSTSPVQGTMQGSLPDPVVSLPVGDPTASLPYVVWTMTIRDYKVSEGLNWPRRFTTGYDGKEYEDLRVSRYRLNPKVDLKIFERAKK